MIQSERNTCPLWRRQLTLQHAEALWQSQKEILPLLLPCAEGLARLQVRLGKSRKAEVRQSADSYCSSVGSFSDTQGQGKNKFPKQFKFPKETKVYNFLGLGASLWH